MTGVSEVRAGPLLGAGAGSRQRGGAFELLPESAPAAPGSAAAAVVAPAALAGGSGAAGAGLRKAAGPRRQAPGL